MGAGSMTLSTSSPSSQWSFHSCITAWPGCPVLCTLATAAPGHQLLPFHFPPVASPWLALLLTQHMALSREEMPKA